MFKGPEGKELKERALKFMMKSPELDVEVLPPSGGPVDSPMDFWKKKEVLWKGQSIRQQREREAQRPS